MMFSARWYEVSGISLSDFVDGEAAKFCAWRKRYAHRVTDDPLR